MGFLAPVIVGAIGLTGSAALIGEAVIGIGLSFGLGAIAKKLQAKSSSSAAALGTQLSLSYDPNGPRQIGVGICASAGTLTYHNTYGPNGNDYVQLVFRLQDVPANALKEVWAAGVKLTPGAFVNSGMATGQTYTQYPGAMWVQFHNGDWDQEADADLVAHHTGNSWSANNRGRGVCYVRVTLKFNAKLFPNGIPPLVFVYESSKLYDWRLDSTNGGSGPQRWGDETTYAFTRNPVVFAYNYMRGLYVQGNLVGGMNVPEISFPLDVWTSSANACDETVSKKDGSTETRYCIDGLFTLDSQHASVIQDVLTTCAGELCDVSGVFKLYPGVARPSVLTITDDDFMSDEAMEYSPKLAGDSLINTVFGSFVDPKQMYQSAALPPRISPDDEAADGGDQLSANYGLSYCISETQGQRVMEIMRRKGRYQRGFSGTLRGIAAACEAGDVITFNSRRYGFSGLQFEILQSTLNQNSRSPVELRETNPAIFAYNPAVDELNPLDPVAVGPGGTLFMTVQNVELEAVLVSGNGAEQIPGLRVTWTPIDDATVTELVLNYRKVGDNVAIQRTIVDPTAGEYTWVEAVQGGLRYEVQMNMVTTPARATVFTAWVPMDEDSVTQPQVVGVAATVADGAIGPDQLSAQTRLELENATALASIQGSVNDRLDKMLEMVSQAAAAAASAAATNQLLYRAVKAQANGNSIQVTETLGAIATLQNGLEAQWTVAIDLNGNVKGVVQLFSDEEASIFTVLADRIVFALPDGTGARQVITVGILPDGSTGVGIDAESVIFKGTIKAEHIDVVSLSTLTITDPDDEWELRLSQGWWGAKDNSRYIDMKNGKMFWVLGT